MIIYWTKEVPKKSGNYLIKKDGRIQSMFISVKDLDIQENDSSYLGDVLWSAEEIEETYL